ncbi:MAG: CDP-alcohol phosphatidyltransferase family protein [Candidatus Micrarchaeota archaeon]|nr:CDP-alcohol phosphatidyltransferase family protein [Candidatus Micrarchaeota archaeon]
MLKQSRAGKASQKWAARLLGGIPLSPDQVTLLALALAIAGFFALAAGQFWAAFLIFILSALCDLADGVIARLRKQASARGAFLDGTTDRLVEFFLLFGLLFYPSWPSLLGLAGACWIVALLFFGSCLTAFVPAYAYYRGIRLQAEWEGFLPRPERLALMLLSIALLSFGQSFLALAVIALATLLSIATAIGRIGYFYSNARK